MHLHTRKANATVKLVLYVQTGCPSSFTTICAPSTARRRRLDLRAGVLHLEGVRYVPRRGRGSARCNTTTRRSHTGTDHNLAARRLLQDLLLAPHRTTHVPPALHDPAPSTGQAAPSSRRTL